MADLNEYARRFTRLRVNPAGGPSPHKPCLLLAVIDQIDDSETPVNRFEYGPALLERYHRYFKAVKSTTDHPNPYFPFFHLQSGGFWHLEAVPGREETLRALGSARSAKQVLDNVEYAYLDDDLFRLLCEPEARAELAEVLVNHWFDRQAGELRDMVLIGRQINHYARNLRELRELEGVCELPSSVRDPAFRRVVLEAYDYRCAATGTRIILPDESVMVQAAHIEPFAVASNDDPRNGLALTPNMHWAMDKHVLAPTPNYTWRVSKEIDRRFAENQPLLELDGAEIILPREKQYWPKREYLEWRVEQLI